MTDTVAPMNHEETKVMIDKIFVGFGNYEGNSPATRKEQTTKFAEYLLASDTPRIWYRRYGQSEEDYKKLLAHYFGRYIDENTLEVNQGETFSMRNLTGRPDTYTNSVFYIADKTDRGFTVHNVNYALELGAEDKKQEVVDSVHTLVFNLEYKQLYYFRNLHRLKGNFANFELVMRDVLEAYGDSKIWFALSPRKHPHMYNMLYQHMSAMDYESSKYVGRFLVRLLQRPYFELVAKSGLPSRAVRDIIHSSDDSYLDLSQTSVRLMFRMQKPIWKMAVRGEIPSSEVRSIVKWEERKVRLHKVTTEEDPSLAQEEHQMDGIFFQDWLVGKLQKVHAYDIYNLSRKEIQGIPYSKRRLYDNRNSDLNDARFEEMSPKVKEYYYRRYQEYLADKYRKRIEANKEILRKTERNYNLFLATVNITNTLNEQYGVNFTQQVISGEGRVLVQENASRGSAIALHQTYGFDLKRLIAYLYYQLPLDQGYKIRRTAGGFDNYTDSTYEDYLAIVTEGGGDFERYPRYLKVAHDIAVANMKIARDKLIQEKLTNRYEEVKHLAKDNPPRAKYFVKVPENVDSFVREGNAMGNCIGSYAHSVASGKSTVVFMRDKREPDKALVDIEIRDNAIVQALQRFNKPMNAEQRKFIEKFAEVHELEVVV